MLEDWIATQERRVGDHPDELKSDVPHGFNASEDDWYQFKIEDEGADRR